MTQQLNKQPVTLLLRRGLATNVNGADTYFAQGEPGYTTDGNVVYVSDGTHQYPVSGHVQRTAVSDAAYQALVTDHLIAYTALTAPRTVTLPSATVGQVIIVKDETGSAGTHTITVAAPAGETIDGAASVALSTNYGVVRCYASGSAWFTC